ncbi:LppU/SCO3897 family protein [Nocardia brasiliensis]
MASPEPPFVVTPQEGRRARAVMYLGILAVLTLISAAVAMQTGDPKTPVPEAGSPAGSQTAVVPSTPEKGQEAATGIPPQSESPVAAPRLAVPSTAAAPPSTEPTALSSAAQAKVPDPVVLVGECVMPGDAAVTRAECGSSASGYRVVGKMDASGRRCPADADRVREYAGESLCLDVDWVVGGCLVLAGGPHRIDCARPDSRGGLRVLNVLFATTDVNRCAQGDRGVVYQQRQFVVCVADL